MSLIRRIIPHRLTQLQAVLVVLLGSFTAMGQSKAWFVDGFHGGIYGHYPTSFTQFIVETMEARPDWKVNLEIEPETWDFARTNTPEAYAALQILAADQSAAGRIEFVNPAYGQSYFWMASGESMIQQLDRGIRKIHQHFPNAEFVTYSSEEPCFTSALPGVLKSLGFKYAVLKNPNTCWGGYTRAFGGELVDWIGPDGTGIPTVSRYGIEALKPGSAWETIANANSPEFVKAALEAGIEHPVGMCLQDAGWRNGPWLGDGRRAYQPTEYTTWRTYFECVATNAPAQNWRVSQEDVQVSLVWGSQVLQRIAKQVRLAENRIVAAEKLAAIAGVHQSQPWPEAKLDDAWRDLMLAQHHDCWIVPYNGPRNDTWADKVGNWTGTTVQLSDDVVDQSINALVPQPVDSANPKVRIFNTLGLARTNPVRVELPKDWTGDVVVRDSLGCTVASQMVSSGTDKRDLLILASVPALGYSTFQLEKSLETNRHKPLAWVDEKGRTVIETDLYWIELDPARGGAIASLMTKRDKREWVDPTSERGFNAVRGYFKDQKQFLSTADHPARIEILEDGPARVRVRIHGQIASNTVTQTLSLVPGERRIDCNVRIDWKDNVEVGSDLDEGQRFRREGNRKAFYEDRYKLQVVFPAKLARQSVFKDAPFDVTESQLTDTFFDAWTDIKNNIVLNWVDVFDPKEQIGLALFSDHTTSYAHGPEDPLGLTLLYSGVGLWGRNYRIHGPTDVNYALMPHTGDWHQAELWMENNVWNEPLIARLINETASQEEGTCSLLSFDRAGWEVPTMRLEEQGVVVRLFNASPDLGTRKLTYAAPASSVALVQLDGTVIRTISIQKDSDGHSVFDVSLPPFGVGTLNIRR